MDIPWIGKFFTRYTDNVTKVDLLIFITAHIVEEGELTPEEVEKLKKGVDFQPVEKDSGNKKTGWDTVLAP